MTPMTIPAIAPPLSPFELVAVMGMELPEAVAGAPKASVVVAETVAVAVAPPLVGRRGAEKEDVGA